MRRLAQKKNSNIKLTSRISSRKKFNTESNNEQNSADLRNCSKEEFDEFKSLNVQYKEKFGFPYIIAVKGKKLEILQNFKQRIKNNRDKEFNEAIDQVKKIATIRLNQI